MTVKRNTVIFGLACVVAASAAGAGAQPASGKTMKAEVKQTVHDAETYAGEKKADYEKRTSAELAELDAKIDHLKKKAEAHDRELGRKRKTVAARFAKVKSASESEWSHFKTGVDDALSDLKKAYTDFAADMK
jgi:uncharacterized protein HemX